MDYVDEMRQIFGAKNAERILASVSGVELSRLLFEALLRFAFGWNMHYWATHSAKHVKTFMYYFTHRPLGDELAAFHAAEIVVAFNNVQYIEMFDSPINRQLAEEISDYWVQFASAGEPSLQACVLG